MAASPTAGAPLPVNRLRAQLTGQVIEPGGAGYDAAREVQNAALDRRPAMIVRVANTEDVRRRIAFAREAGLRLTVRGGGHSPAGHAVADRALMVDCSGMRDLGIDPERRLAWAEPGLTAGDYTRAAAAHGLATPLGDTASVGMAGITLSGTASRSTTWSPSRSSRRAATFSPRAKRRTPTCSGRCGVGAATSGS